MRVDRRSIRRPVEKILSSISGFSLVLSHSRKHWRSDFFEQCAEEKWSEHDVEGWTGVTLDSLEAGVS